MQPSDILKKIRSCDKDEPFVFVSYSSLDAQRVWEDVLRFQQMGYNVWLDEKNLDKTKASWQDDALESIRDFNCALLVYYVSRNSLVSQACFSELACTVEDTTQAIHNGPVKFIAVDVEPIDDIIKFKNEVHGELARKKMDKAEKTAQAITLSKCINQFFNSNNKRVRVKAYSLPNRKMDYYEDITASFPDETRVYESKVEKTEPKTVVKEKPVAVAPVETPKPAKQPQKPAPAEKKPELKKETVTKNEIAQTVLAAPVAPKTAVNQIPAQPEKKEEPKKPSQPPMNSVDWLRILWEAIEQANKVFEKAGKSGFKQSFELSERQRKNAEVFIAKKDFGVFVEALLDTTMFGSGKEGILLADVFPVGFGASLFTTNNAGVEVPLSKVVKVRNGDYPGRLHISLYGGKELNLQFGVYQEGIRALLETFAKTNRERFGVKQEAASVRSAAPVMKTEKKAPKAFSLEQAFADANQKLGKDATNRFTVYKDISEKQMRNFRKTMGVPDSLEITGIEALWGFGDGHEAEGLLVDENKLYYGTNLCSKVEYRKVTDVECFSGDDMLIVHCEDSVFGKFVGPTTLGAPIKAFLQACIDQRK